MRASILRLLLVGLYFLASVSNAEQAFEPSFLPGEFIEGYVPHRSNAGEPDDSGWFFARSTKGRFAIKLPYRFEDWSVEVPDWKAQSHSVGGASGDSGIAMLVSEFPRFDEDGEMEIKSFTKAISKGRGFVRYRRYFDYQGYPASQSYIRGRERSSITRYIILPDRFYQLSIEFPAKKFREARRMQRPFFESFQLF